MAIKVKYQVEVDSGANYSESKSFDTLNEAKDYEATLALAEIICSCPTVYVHSYQAETLAAHILKGMKEAKDAAEAELKAAWLAQGGEAERQELPL